MSLFCLVHGAFQGAWCWDLLIPFLQAQGHKTVAMDLPIDNASTTLSEFADTVIQSLPEIDDDIVLVGHSMAGTVIPLVAEAINVRQLIFIAALIPHPGVSTLDRFSRHLDSETLKSFNYQPKDPSILEQFHSEPDIFEPASVGKDFSDAAVLKEFFYSDCQPDVAQWAIAKSRSQQSLAYIFETNPLTALPKVERKYIVCTNDRIISSTWSRYAARQRLGVDAIELASGHCPHLSHPDLLASVLMSNEQSYFY
ncbi:alpha/beta fold hydrolase [Chroococcidiopsis sp. TS-821]|uniref:alpha/beta fold hydrolase n=1 Tax=Chroococcidiopsis sp. TS-821 TaxID=1378066 RepID=UPI000CEF1CB9|nr:alpha/beta hydrolase [Chroococcidiopsis sp. TS-821]PPS41189.1 alpha/beta hydrolase [Chroococcidiopsis sp. TS-821]